MGREMEGVNNNNLNNFPARFGQTGNQKAKDAGVV